jgi:Sec-independent protein secretion pathway component TatC
MNDVTILDLFWFLLKLIAALGMVCAAGIMLYLVWAAAKRVAITSWDILRGRNASVAATVCFAIGVVVLVTCVALGVPYLNEYLREHPQFLH